MWQLKKLSNKGDTIIEVLIALAILGFTLSITYSIASRAQQTVRAAQERVEALKLAEGQLEQLKNIATTNPSTFATIANYGRPFCINSGGATQFSAANSLPPDFNADSFNYPSQCTNLGSGGLYNVSIVAPGSPVNNPGGPFVVRVRWNRIGGNGNDEVKLEYRLYAD